METLSVELKDLKALSILKGMEKAGLILLNRKRKRNKNAVNKFRGTILKERAISMISTIENERSEWDKRF